jgi:hypothetical protein
VTPARIVLGCLLLGATTPAPADPPAAAPEDWTVVATPSDRGCAAKTPPVDGIMFGLALSSGRALRIMFAGETWTLPKDLYKVPVRLDDQSAGDVNLFGNGKALIGLVSPEFKTALMSAGKIGFHFIQKDYSIPVRDLSGVVARLETCIAEHGTGTPAK